MKRNIKSRLPLKILLGVIMVALMSLFACTDKFMEINTDKTALTDIGPKEYNELFAYALHQGLAWQSTDDMSRMSSTLGLHNAGYTSCGIQSYDQYMLSPGWENSGFQDIYSSVVPTLLTLMDAAKTAGNDVAYSIADIWKVFQLQRATDVWGPTPYTEAGSGKESVAYDSQKDIYYMMLDELSNDVTVLNNALANNPNLNCFSTGDLIYSGSVAEWAKFANTLRLRMAIRISNVDPDKAKTEAEAAVAAGPMMETNSDDALLATINVASEGNGMPRMQSFYQDVMSTSMESVLKGYNDPRMQEFWSPVIQNLVNKNFPAEYKNNIGQYKGFVSGADPVQYTYLRAYSYYGPRFLDGNQYVTPINVMHASETFFLKAEGAWRGWNMGGTAQSFYEKGIEVSIKQWRGTEISNDSINKYVNSTLTPIAPDDYPYYDPAMTNIPIKFSSDKNTQYEQIMTQKWIALFPLGFEAWAEYRRTRLPKLYPKKYSVNSNINPAAGQIMTRCPFARDEVSANAAAVEKAVSLLKGPDLETTPLWWDVNPN